MASQDRARGGQRVLISGGGIAGLTLAYWLHHHGLQPTVIEQAPRLRPEGYAIDFGGSGWDVAERMQLIRELRQRQNTVPYFIFKDGVGRTLARLPTVVFQRAFQGKMIQTMRPDLESVLYEAIRDTVPIRFGTSIQRNDTRDNQKLIAARAHTSGLPPANLAVQVAARLAAGRSLAAAHAYWAQERLATPGGDRGRAP